MQFSRGSFFPIEVTETKEDYEVKIAPGEKERAKKIPGRRWDPKRTRWVYPKKMACYRALKQEFGRDAAIFQLGEPASKRLPPPAPAEAKPGEATVRKRLENLDEGVKTLLSIVDNVEKSTRKTQSLVEGAFEPSESRSDGEVDLTERTNLRDLEKMLKELAFQVSGDPSFKVWMREMEPIMYPREFVESTHEEIRRNISQMLGVEGRARSSFPEYVSRLQAEGLLPTGSVPKASYVLRSMNDHRNRIAHARRFEMSDAERFTRSIIYLFNLALVWNYVASEQLDQSDIG
jgi:hypothetical protein